MTPLMVTEGYTVPQMFAVWDREAKTAPARAPGELAPGERVITSGELAQLIADRKRAKANGTPQTRQP